MRALRTLKVPAALLVALVASLGCSNSSSGGPASSSRLTSPTSAAITADTKASDFRTRLDLLLAEHAMIVAKQASAAATRTDSYTGYATLLTTNGSELTDLMRSAFGDGGAAQFDQLWSAQNGYLVDYTIGLVAHNQTKSSGALSGLTNEFVPRFSKFLNSMTQIPLDPTTQLVTEQVLELQKVIDDEAAQSYSTLYADLVNVYMQSTRLGDQLAGSIVKKFADKFPGDPSNSAANARASLDSLLQEHAYLASMITDAGLGGREPERAAGVVVLAANADALGTLFSGLYGAPAGTRFDQVWAARDAALIAYGGSGDAGTRQTALTNLTEVFVSQVAALVQSTTGLAAGTISPPTLAQAKAAAQVIDDQRAKAIARLASDDGTSASMMQAIGDLIINATRFS
jgi:hypothetical protein